MGVHSGPVSGVIDVNERANVAGAGINMAQRVMDCGDGGHILLSKHVAEDLEQYGHWQPLLHNLGECEVKHGVRVSVVNLYTEELGNPAVPEKLRQARIEQRSIGKSLRRKLAVLPLVNESSDPAREYLSDGISEGIIDVLAQLPGLQVLARSTVFRYKSEAIYVQEIGRALNVDVVLTGRLLLQANKVIIKTELVAVEDGTQIWGDRFICEDAEVFTLEETLVREIAEKLRVRFTDEDRQRFAKAQTENTQAYHLYLKGRYCWNKRTKEEIRASIQHFKQAIDEDPNYARAWAGLADSHTILGCWGYVAPHESYPKARRAAERALELDGDLPEAHVSLAVTLKDYYWDWRGAEKEYKRGLELNPNNSVARQWYAEFLACVGRHAEAIAECARARQLDPLSQMAAATQGRHGYFFARQYERAREELGNVVRTDPEFWIGHNFLGWTYAVAGQFAEAMAAFSTAKQLDDNPETLVGLGFTFGISGERARAEEILRQLQDLRKQNYVQPVSIALVYTGLGEKDEAFEWLDKAYEEHAQWLSEIKVDPAFDPLRTDARFTDLLKRVGLEATPA
jgi:TolB-like protein/Tfp pilus assembly protein PilF